MNNPLVGIIMGSKSDLPTMQKAADILNELEIVNEMQIISAHRTPHKLIKYAESAIDRGIEVIIAGAGGAAHLPGVTASLTLLPIIGIPIESKSLKGMDSLLSIVQMPSGIPVATVGIDNATNAGLLAARILGIKYPQIQRKVLSYIENMRQRLEKEQI